MYRTSLRTRARFGLALTVAVGLVAGFMPVTYQLITAQAQVLPGIKGPGQSGSSGRIPAQPKATSVPPRVSPYIMAPGVFDTATAKPRVFGRAAALDSGVVGEVANRRTLKDASKTTWQLGAAVSDVVLPGQGAKPGKNLVNKGDAGQERAGDEGGDREGPSRPAVRIRGNSGKGNGASELSVDDDVIAEVGEPGSRVRLGAPLGGGRGVRAVVSSSDGNGDGGQGKSSFKGGGPDGSDLELEATSTGLKESVVLRSPPAGQANYVIRYPLMLDPGLTPSLAEKGSKYSGVVIRDSNDRVVWVLPDGDALDSTPEVGVRR